MGLWTRLVGWSRRGARSARDRRMDRCCRQRVQSFRQHGRCVEHDGAGRRGRNCRAGGGSVRCVACRHRGGAVRSLPWILAAQPLPAVRADISRRRWKHADRICRGDARDDRGLGCRGAVAGAGDGLAARRCSRARHVPRSRLSSTPRRIDSHRWSRPPHAPNARAYANGTWGRCGPRQRASAALRAGACCGQWWVDAARACSSALSGHAGYGDRRARQLAQGCGRARGGTDDRHRSRRRRRGR